MCFIHDLRLSHISSQQAEEEAAWRPWRRWEFRILSNRKERKLEVEIKGHGCSGSGEVGRGQTIMNTLGRKDFGFYANSTEGPV